MSLEGTTNEDQIMDVSGEAIVTANQVLNHTIRGEMQRRKGKSGWELHSGVTGSAEWLKSKPKFLSLVYCMIKKKNRRGKTCSKTNRALYCSEDIEIPGALRVIPYRRDGDVVEFYPTEVIFSYKCIYRMPLLEIAEDADADEDGFDHEYSKEADEDEDEGAHAPDEDGDEGAHAEEQEGTGESVVTRITRLKKDLTALYTVPNQWNIW